MQPFSWTHTHILNNLFKLQIDGTDLSHINAVRAFSTGKGQKESSSAWRIRSHSYIRSSKCHKNTRSHAIGFFITITLQGRSFKSTGSVHIICPHRQTVPWYSTQPHASTPCARGGWRHLRSSCNKEIHNGTPIPVLPTKACWTCKLATAETAALTCCMAALTRTEKCERTRRRPFNWTKPSHTSVWWCRASVGPSSSRTHSVGNW